MTATLSTDELYATLHRLALLLAILSPAVWLVAAIGGRWFVRQALAPVEQMAREARSIKPDNSRRRLSSTSTGDELATLGQAFNGLLDQLFAAYDRQSRFAGDAAHQLRTPLTVLEGEIDVALRRPRSTDEYAQTLRVLKQQVGELSQMVEVLLQLARPASDRYLPDVEDVDLADWLDNHLQKWRKNARWADFSVTVAGGLQAHLSPLLLAQVLDNLLSNSVKYSEAGAPIHLDLHARDGMLEIAVEDHGIGIPADERQAVFEPFYRTQQARQSGRSGTGLGLAIAARTAEAMGGTLECTGTGDGTRFVIRLPLQKLAKTTSGAAY